MKNKPSKSFNLKKNALHDYLGMPHDSPIPSTMLHELAHGNHSEHVRKMAQFALNSKKFKR